MAFGVLKPHHAVVTLGDLASNELLQFGHGLIGLKAQFAVSVRNSDSNFHVPSVRQSAVGFSLEV